MQTRRQDVRSALVWAVASYIPFVFSVHAAGTREAYDLARGIGLYGGPWTLALLCSLATAYFLLVDAVLPIGRSKLDIVRGAWRRGLALVRRRTADPARR